MTFTGSGVGIPINAPANLQETTSHETFVEMWQRRMLYDSCEVTVKSCCGQHGRGFLNTGVANVSCEIPSVLE